MAPYKALREALNKRALTALGIHNAAGRSSLLPSHFRHLWTCNRSTLPLPKPALPQCAENLWKHRSFMLRYSTCAGNKNTNTRQQELLDDSSNGGLLSRFSLIKLGFGVVVATVGGYFWYHSNERKGPIQARKPEHTRPASGSSVHGRIGGPFKLISHRREVVTDRDLVGKWTLIYFGYTSCPDCCPEELQKLAQVVDKIEKQSKEEVKPVFITIDPERDSIEQIRAYITEFHPNMIGLTGSIDDIRQVAREYRVYYRRVEEEGSDYLVDHSNLIYLLDAHADPVKLFGREYNASTLAAEVMDIMNKKTQ